MLHQLVISTLGLFTLANCQSQNNTEIKNRETTSVVSTPAKKDPQMSVGLPPDQQAIETAKEEQRMQNDKQSGLIYLSEGENKFLKEYDLNVTFKRLTEDSRCPKDVECVWAGNAMALIELMGTYTRPVTLELSTTENASKGLYNSQNFNGYEIALIKVTPQPTSSEGFKALQGKYKIALKFEKKSGDDPKNYRGETTTK